MKQTPAELTAPRTRGGSHGSSRQRTSASRFSLASAVILLTAFAMMPSAGDAQTFDEEYAHWPELLRIKGTLALAGGMPDAAFVVDLLGEMPKTMSVLADGDTTNSYLAPLMRAQKEGNELTVRLAEPDKLVESLRDAIHAGGRHLFFTLSKPLTKRQHEALTPKIRAELRQLVLDFLGTGATLICDHAASSLIGEIDTTSDMEASLGVARDTIIMPGYSARSDQPRLLKALEERPGSVGIGVPKGSTVILRGRKMQVAGDGEAHFLLASNEREGVRKQVIRAPRARRPPESWLIDWTQWRREAMDRTLPVFSPEQPPTPCVEKGTLVIVGGGGTPRGLMAKIVDLAGGPDKAKMVYIPCAEQDDVGDRQRTVDSWKRMGVKHATFIHTKDRKKADTDADFYAPLKDATGLWFGGGRQWNFADSYYGTTTHKLMKEVLKRGGVIGGSSAGASIQARFLARATPIGNYQILAPGYERGGLGFIGGVAIDQHFSQRGRQKDMTQLVTKYPQLLGIGLDESTAIIVTSSRAEVVGAGAVFFYDRTIPVQPNQPDYIALRSGSVYDLAGRRILRNSKQPLPPLEN